MSILAPYINTLVGFSFLSIPNLNTEAPIFSVSTYTKSVELVVIISAIPYSAVDKTLVYNGTKKKDKNFDPKDDKVKSAVFWIKYEYFDLLKFSFSLFINFFPLEFAKNFLLYIIAFSIFNF